MTHDEVAFEALLEVALEEVEAEDCDAVEVTALPDVVDSGYQTTGDEVFLQLLDDEAMEADDLMGVQMGETIFWVEL